MYATEKLDSSRFLAAYKTTFGRPLTPGEFEEQSGSLFHCFCWILGWTDGPAEETSLPSLETWEDRSTTNHPKVIMKFCLLLIIAGLVCGFSRPARAQERNTIDPQVSQEVEALNLKYDEAFNRNDAEAVATLFTADAVETGPEEVASGQQEIEDRYKILFESHPNRHATKLDQVYAIGSASAPSQNGA